MGTSQFVSWRDAPRLSARTDDVGKPGLTTAGWNLTAFIENPKHKTPTITLAAGYSYPTGWSQNGNVVNWNGSSTPVTRTPMRWLLTVPGESAKLSPIGWVETLLSETPKPQPPTNLAAEGLDQDRIEVSWVAPTTGSTPVKYRVYHGAGQYGPWTLHDEDLDGSPHVDSGFDPGQTVWFCVSTVDGNTAESTQSLAVSGMTFPGSPEPPVSYAASGTSSNTIQVSWIPSMTEPLAATFNLYSSATETGTYSSVATGLTASPYDHTPLSTDTVYWYKLTGVDASGAESVRTAAFSGRTQPAALPGIPQGVATEGQSTSIIRVSWQAVSGATSYNLYQAVALDRPWNFRANVSTLFADYTLTNEPTAGKTVYFQVSAVNSAGEGQRSATVPGTTLQLNGPAVPQSVAAAPTANQREIKVSWIPGADGTAVVNFKVYRATVAGGAGSHIGSPTASPYTDSDAALADGTTYYYKVSAVDATPTESDKSAEAPGTTLAALGPSTPVSIAVDSLSQTELKVRWNPGAGGSEISKFRVWRSETGTVGSFEALTPTVSVTSFTDGTLQAGYKRWYTVSAIDINGAESGQSVSASNTTQSAPPPDDTADWYVSVNGNDSATGTSQTNALRTINQALNKAQPGDVIAVMNGTYSAPITSVRSGTASAPITLKALSGHTPLVAGTGSVAGDRICLMSHDYLIFGEGIRIRGTNSSAASYPTSAPEKGCTISGNNNTASFDVTDVKFDFYRISGDRNRILNANCNHCGAWDRGDGFDAGNGLVSNAGAAGTTVQNTRLSTGGHDSASMNGEELLVSGCLLTNDWQSYVGTNKGNRIASFTYSNGTPPSGATLRAVIEDTVFHSAYPSVDSGGAAGHKNMLRNTLYRRFFVLNIQTGGGGIAMLSPGAVGDGANPGASDQRYCHGVIWSCLDEGLSFIDNNGYNFGPFYFTNMIFDNLATGGGRGITFQYRSQAALASRRDWKNLLFFDTCVFDVNYNVRIQDKDGVNATIDSTVSGLASSFPNNFTNIIIGQPNFVSQAVPASTDPATALSQAQANFTPQLAGALGTGTWLTRVNVAGGVSNSTSVTVDDAKWFRDKYGRSYLTGDVIFIEGAQAGARTITNISGNVLTLNTAVTCADNAKVWLGNSATPNIGAVL